jgi:trk system potassium uptake protein TrkA
MKVIIVGGGQVGAYIANLLINNKCTVKIIDNRKASLTKLRKVFTDDIIVEGNGTDPGILEACGIADADVVAAVTGADEANLVAATVAKFEFGVPRVIARVNNPKNAWLFNKGMGVDVEINQADLMAHIAVEEIDLRNMLTLMKLNHGNYSIVEVKVDTRSEAAGHEIKDINVPKTAVLIAVYRDKNVLIPRGDTVIEAGDTILAFVDNSDQPKINKLFGMQI